MPNTPYARSTAIAAAAALVILSLASVGVGQAPTTKPAFAFRDVGDETGLFPHLGGIRGHGVAWGDTRGTGYPDLFVASFHDQGSKPGMFFLNDKGKFRLDTQEQLHTSGMGSGALFADLTNNGRLDLYVSTCAMNSKADVRKVPSYLLRNDGDGKFTDISKESGIVLPFYAGRGLAAVDADGDGLLDLAVAERYYGAVKVGTVLWHNEGNHKFKNIAQDAGLPLALSGLAIAVADLNGDTWPDLFLTEADGNHRLFLNDGKGKFHEAPGSREVFKWKNMKKDECCAGVCIADINRDGLPDIVIGHHNDSPWTRPAGIRVYLNKGVKDGVPIFKDITEICGLFPLTMKPPHVEIQDFDNDGWPDIYVSVVKFKDGKPYPIIFKNLGNEGGVPRFRAEGWDVNDFPNKEEQALKRSGPLFDSLIKNRRIIYMAAAPTADFDRDGRLDMVLANWWTEDRSLLLRNETPGGNWLDVRVEGKNGVNRMGIGSVVKIYRAGQLGKADALLGYREIAAGYGYCSGQEAIAHFGLGKDQTVDIHVTLPHNKGTFERHAVAANQRVVLSRP